MGAQQPSTIAAIYLRQSEDRSGEGLAVERQRQDALALCELRGWTPREYTDNDLSAKRPGRRPAFAAMLADIGAGRVGAVVAWNVDRLYRNPADRLALIEAGKDAKPRPITIALVRGSDIDLSTPSGRMVAGILGEVAQNEIDVKADRQVRAAQQRAARGLPWGPRRPFGFQQGGMVLEPAEAAALRAAYTDVLGGRPIARVAAEWNERGLATTLGNPWTGTGLSALLRNPRNAGLRAYRGVVQAEPAAWPAIVDEALWAAVSAVLSDRQRYSGGGGTPTNLMTGVGRCGRCGGGVRKGQRTRDKVAFYRCNSHHHLSRTASAVDAMVGRVLAERLSREDAPDLLVDPDRPDAAALRAERDVIQASLDELDKGMGEGSVDLTRWSRLTKRLLQRRADIDAALAVAYRSPALADLVQSEDVVESWAATPFHSRQAVLRVLADWWVLGRDGNDAVPADARILGGLVALRWH